MRFASQASAVRGFTLIQFYYSESTDSGIIAVTDSIRVWIFRAFLAPDSISVKLADGRTLNGLELWDAYFEVTRGFFTLARFQALAMLHEFQHIQGVALPDYDDPPANYLNSILTVEHCFPDWVPKETLNRLESAEKLKLRKTPRNTEKTPVRPEGARRPHFNAPLTDVFSK
jgi:hypothetical protein